MNGVDLFLAINNVNDFYIEEAIGDAKKKLTRSGICKAIVAAAVVLFMVFAGNKVLFLHGDLRYKIVKISNVFQPQDEMNVGRKLQAWKELPLNKRYSQLCMGGVVYRADIEACDEKEQGRFLGTFSVQGKEYKRVGVLLCWDVEILHETEVDVYEIIGKDPKNTVMVKFGDKGRCYVYDRAYK